MWCILITKDGDLGGMVGSFIEKGNAEKYIELLNMGEIDESWKISIMQVKDWYTSIPDRFKREDIMKALDHSMLFTIKAENLFFDDDEKDKV